MLIDRLQPDKIAKMNKAASETGAYAKNQILLAIGPQPPPVGGVTATFQTFLNELTRCPSIETTVINTSPAASAYLKQTDVFGLKTWQRAISILKRYLQKIKGCDAAIIFANSTFVYTLGPLLLLLAHWYHKPLFFRVFGAIDLELKRQQPLRRNYSLMTLNRLKGLLVETQQVQTALTQMGCPNIYYVPAYRPMPELPRPQTNSSTTLHLIFLSHIRREKGPFILLEALRLLAQEPNLNVTCDFYGPIFDDERTEFLQQLEMTPDATYVGLVEVGAASSIIARYDALVLPTYFVDEGQPGTLVEAMHVGVPIISTNFRAIPELVTHGENGLLIPAQDSTALAEAIKCLALDSPLRERMGAANYRRGQAFRADVVVSQILGIIFPQ